MSDASDLKRALEANDAEERRRAMSAMRRAEGPVSVALLTQALRGEFAKLERSWNFGTGGSA